MAAEAVVVARRHWGSLSPHARQRLRELVAKSKGRPGNLSKAERRELIGHVRQLDFQTLARDLGDVASPVRLARLRRFRRRR
jgi:hypothetical protein